MLETINGLDVALFCAIPFAYLWGTRRGYAQGYEEGANRLKFFNRAKRQERI